MSKNTTQTSHSTHSPKPKLLLVAKIGRAVGFDGALKLHISTDFPHIFQPGATFHLNKKLFVQPASPTDKPLASSQNPAQIEYLRIASFHADKNLVVFEGFTSRESAERLVNYELYSTLEESRAMCGLKEGEFLWEELIGAEIRDFEAVSESSLDSGTAPASQSLDSEHLPSPESGLDSHTSPQAAQAPLMESVGELLGHVRGIERIGEVDYFCIDTDSELIAQGLPKSFLVPYIPHYVLSLSPGAIRTHRARALLENS